MALHVGTRLVECGWAYIADAREMFIIFALKFPLLFGEVMYNAKEIKSYAIKVFMKSLFIVAQSELT